MLLFVLSSNFLSISQLLLFVNNFFIFLLNFLKFVAAVFSGELYNIKPSNKCQQFFSIFLFFFNFFIFSFLFVFSCFMLLFHIFCICLLSHFSSSQSARLSSPPYNSLFSSQFLLYIFIEITGVVLFHRQCFHGL